MTAPVVQRVGLPYTSKPQDPNSEGVHVRVHMGGVLVAGETHSPAAAIELSAAIATAANNVIAGRVRRG